VTISLTVGRRLTVGQVIKTGLELAGLLHPAQQPSLADKQSARILLDVMISELEIGGGGARAVTFYNLPLTVGTYRYSLPDWIVGVPGEGMYIPAGTADLTKATGESTINQIDRERWHMISTKNAPTSRPSMFYLNRVLDELAVWFWGIPDEAGTVRFQVQRMLANCDDDNATVDLEPFWMSWLCWELSWQWAASKTLPVESWGARKVISDSKKKIARGKANQLVDNQMIIMSNTRR
jgi:hypothetical protein